MTRPYARFTGPELCARPAREIVSELRQGHLRPSDLIDAAQTRTQQVEPDINAMPTTCFDRARAAVADLEQGEQDHPAWMAGLPVGIKDLNLVGGVRTTFGNRALSDFVPDTTDPLVARLEQRGALVVGKTNTPEFGAGGNSTNAVFGSTRNPWDTRMNAGGSSGGAAAGLAAGEVWLSHGSDLMGSSRTPAAHCGVVGLRPSPGRCGGGPGIAGFMTEGLQGPMARDVRDLALFLDAMGGWDPVMPISLEPPMIPFQSAIEQAPRAPRIAFSEDQNGFSPVESEIRAVLRSAIHAVERAGAEVTDACPELPHLNETYLTLRGLHYSSLVAKQPAEVQAAFGPRLKENVAFGLALSPQEIFEVPTRRAALYEIMRGFLQTHDVLAIPVVGIAPDLVEKEFPDTVDGQKIGTYEDWLRFSFLATTTLLPALSLPVGFTAAGLPVGLQLIGPPRGEAVLLQVALFIEETLGLPATPIDPIRRHTT